MKTGSQLNGRDADAFGTHLVDSIMYWYTNRYRSAALHWCDAAGELGKGDEGSDGRVGGVNAVLCCVVTSSVLLDCASVLLFFICQLRLSQSELRSSHFKLRLVVIV